MEAFSSWSIGPIGGGIATLTAALISVLVTLFVVQKRKRVVFFVSDTEDLTVAVKRNMPGMMLKLNDKEVPNLNRAVVFARNVGNDVIDNFVVSLSIDGPHDFFVGDIRASEQLKNYATQSHCHGENRDAVTVSLPFLNPKEHFTITLFFDGETNPCKVEFRMAGVKSKTKASPVTAFGPELLVALSRNVLFKAILKLF